MLRVVRATMARAIRAVSIERGKDVRRYTLVAFGGAGPLHATALARELQITRVVVPPAPGTLAALGLLVASRRADASLSRPMPCDPARNPELRSILHELTERVLAELAQEGIGFQDVTTDLDVDCRYEGQSHELRIPVRGQASFAALADDFHVAHGERFGFSREHIAVEAVTFRAAALGPRGAVPSRAPAASATMRPLSQRLVAGVEVPVYARDELGAGSTLSGPAVVVELDSTTWIDDRSTATVHSSGALLVEVAS
jgi:N-methylhydantoinase A